MPGPFLQLQMQAADSRISRSHTLSPSIHPEISNLINPQPADSTTARSHPTSCPPTLRVDARLPENILVPPAPLGIQHPRPRPRPRMRPVPQSPPQVLGQHSNLVAGSASPFRDPSLWFQLPATPTAYSTHALPRSSPAWGLSSPGYPAQDWMRHLPPPNSPSPASNAIGSGLRPLHPDPSHSDKSPSLPRVGPPPVQPRLAPRPVSPAVLPGNLPAAPHILVAEPADPAALVPAPPRMPTDLGGGQADREGTPSTIVISDTDSVVPSPTNMSRRQGVNGNRALRRSDAMTEPEMLRELLAGRKRKQYQPWEDLRLVRYLTDPEHEGRMTQAQLKVKKGCVPKVFEQASHDAFMGAREPKSLHDRWGIIKKTFAVVHRLETATGGNGDADHANEDSNQTMLEKLGSRLHSASKHMRIENLTPKDYLFWVEDSVDGLYALLADSLSNDVSVVRQHQYRSGAISPTLSPAVLDLDKDDDSVVVLDDEPALAPDSRKDSAASPPPLRSAHRRDRKTKTDDPEFTVASGLAFIRETQSYHAARAETDRRRLELESDRFKLEQANEQRAEQRLRHEQERIELLRAEQVHLAAVAQDSHQLELARLDLARERNQDLKRRAELDELDRLRTHKRLRAETITNTALQIQADKDDRYSMKLKEASQEHILALFAQAREQD